MGIVRDPVAVQILHVSGGAHHVPAADAVFVALFLDCGVKKPLDLPGIFDLSLFTPLLIKLLGFLIAA